MTRWKLLGWARVQTENPRLTLPGQVRELLFDSASVPSQEVFWVIDTEYSLPAITATHPTLSDEIDTASYTPLQATPEGSTDYATINELLRGSGFTTNPNGQQGFALFEPGEKRVFFAQANEDTPAAILVATVEECLEQVERDDIVNQVETAKVAFDAGLDQIAQRALQGEDATERFGPLFDDIAALKDICNAVDSSVRELIRQVDGGRAREMVERQYTQQIVGALSEHDIAADSLFSGLYDYERPVLDSVDIPLHVDIERDMQRMMFRTPSGNLPIDEPELLWDCHCETPRGSFSQDQRPPTADEHACPIHSHELGTAVTELFGERPSAICYEETDIIWLKTSDLWPPSVDAFHVYEALRTDGVFDRSVTSAVDIGCGTGFIGIGIAKACPNLRELYLSDWVLAPLAISKLNFQRNSPYGSGSDPQLKLRLGLGSTYAHHPDLTERDEHLDLCVCNPPYLPDLDVFDDIRINHTVGGTDLLENVIAEGPSVADSVYVHFSDIAQAAAREAADESGVELTLVGEKSTVPFRVAHALTVDDYTEALLEHGLEERSSGRYKYWHDIGTYRVEN